jgi:hypothetical protein
MSAGRWAYEFHSSQGKTSNAQLGYFKMAKGNWKAEVRQNAFGMGA